MKLEITPQPSEDERAAIVAALALDAEQSASAWPETVLPGRDGPDPFDHAAGTPRPLKSDGAARA